MGVGDLLGAKGVQKKLPLGRRARSLCLSPCPRSRCAAAASLSVAARLAAADWVDKPRVCWSRFLSQEYLKKNNIKNAVEKVVNAAVKQKALEPYSVMVSPTRPRGPCAV